MIKSILWRVMRYQSVKILSDLQFGSNVSKVNNGAIVKWCNARLTSSFGDAVRCKLIKNLSDWSLTTGVYYLELMRSVLPRAVDEALMNVSVAPLSYSIKKDYHLHDKFYAKRKENLKYAMTLIRRYGVDLFINVEDLFRLEPRAVVSILAAVMTIALSREHIREEQEKEPETEMEKEKEKEMEQGLDELESEQTEAAAETVNETETVAVEKAEAVQEDAVDKAKEKTPAET